MSALIHQSLLDTVRRHADSSFDSQGICATSVPGLFAIRATRPSEITFSIDRPLVAMILQGRKCVISGNTSLEFGAGESLMISADIPTISQITTASVATPYYSLVFEIDIVTVEELVQKMEAAPAISHRPVLVDETETEVAEAALRLMKLNTRPSALPVLKDQMARELHYWLLAGRHGNMLRSLGVVESHARRVARAVGVIRSNYKAPLRVEQLAEAAGMSPSAFHQHFRAITSLTPLQFVKRLRLIEARRMMFAEGAGASHAAYAVGDESVPQFNREYRRLFGQPPIRDLKSAQSRAAFAA
ncbi:hypothetical protein P775_07730 [Puniceibacterium antarcticum]|uniref:HTH araC/xylS-type domain-containing protein n=1 Tax=Puniceibacterium antarcticum TaxID=1206336 RepID=A0A2G8RGY7_9RHOB|nr:AraC family transcriptional regulator [Puniceibacterium antarcticum]PIL20790.1 hypothetical protein P775_07730 [Puniceibacterium antarcticum]